MQTGSPDRGDLQWEVAAQADGFAQRKNSSQAHCFALSGGVVTGGGKRLGEVDSCLRCIKALQCQSKGPAVRQVSKTLLAWMQIEEQSLMP